MRLLLAGNHVQAVRYLDKLKSEGKDISDIKEISDPYMIMGIERGTEIILYGTYSNRSNWDYFHSIIDSRLLKRTYAT